MIDNKHLKIVYELKALSIFMNNQEGEEESKEFQNILKIVERRYGILLSHIAYEKNVKDIKKEWQEIP